MANYQEYTLLWMSIILKPVYEKALSGICVNRQQSDSSLSPCVLSHRPFYTHTIVEWIGADQLAMNRSIAYRFWDKPKATFEHYTLEN